MEKLFALLMILISAMLILAIITNKNLAGGISKETEKSITLNIKKDEYNY